MRSASKVNAVSKLHGDVTRAMWGAIWPDRTDQDRPVSSITNGVHVSTWIAADLADLRELPRCGLERTPGRAPLGPHPRGSRSETVGGATVASPVSSRSSASARQRWLEERVGIPRVVAAGPLLAPDALTIGLRADLPATSVRVDFPTLSGWPAS
jgi:starch phosphorylase